jgi:hypothetical protein
MILWIRELSRHNSNRIIIGLSLTLKVDTGVTIVGGEPEKSTGGGGSETPPLTPSGFASPKNGGPLPTILFARKHSMNVPKSLLKSSAAAELEEEEKKASKSGLILCVSTLRITQNLTF